MSMRFYDDDYSKLMKVDAAYGITRATTMTIGSDEPGNPLVATTVNPKFVLV